MHYDWQAHCWWAGPVRIDKIDPGRFKITVDGLVSYAVDLPGAEHIATLWELEGKGRNH